MSYIKWVKKDFDELNKYLYADNNRKITKEDFEKMFKQDVNVISMVIDEDDINWYDTEKIVTPIIYIVCQFNDKQRGFGVPCEWFLPRGYSWKDYVGAKVDFFTGKGYANKWFSYSDA